MTRREELIKATGNIEVYGPLIDEVLFIEERLRELKKLPFIVVHPTDATKQKTTPAGKQYKELMQQYTLALKALERKPKQGAEKDSDDVFANFLESLEGGKQ